jgi:RNA polymerase sigma-70 factor (ECF subfamily)
MADLGQDVIRRAQENDIAAFETIYRYYSGMVYRVALRMTGHVEDAEEVTQEVFLSVHKHLRSFAGQSSLKTWIYRITVNCSLNVQRKKRSRYREMPWEEGFDPEDARDDARETVEREARQDVINGLLERLNPDQRACLVLRSQEGLSYEEIARALNINMNTVRSRLKRARETLLAFESATRVASGGTS